MANMNYCRFENTYRDLSDCYDALTADEFDSLSESEKQYAKELIKLCISISEEFQDLVKEVK